MYLILSIEEADERNIKEAQKRHCKRTKRWWYSESTEKETALFVGDGDGLTKTELKKCVKELPKEFKE